MKKTCHSFLVGAVLAITFFLYTSENLSAAFSKSPQFVPSFSSDAETILCSLNEIRESNGVTSLLAEPSLASSTKSLISQYSSGISIKDAAVNGKKGSVQLAQKGTSITDIINKLSRSSASEYFLSYNRCWIETITNNNTCYAVIILE